MQGFLTILETAGNNHHLRHIQKLAFHGTMLHPEQLPAFQKALESLSSSLQSLTITSPGFAAHSVGQKPFSAGDKWMFFRSASKLTHLTSLKLHEALWNVLMSDDDDVADPLWRVEGVVVEDCETGVVLGPATAATRSLKSASDASDKRS